MLAEMPRVIEDARIHLGKLAKTKTIGRVEALFFKPAIELVSRVDLVMRIDLRKLPEHLLFKAECFTYFAERRFPAIADNVCRHSRPALAVFFVDMLDDFLAVVTRRQIDIDVGVLLVCFGQEAFEQKLVGDRLNGSYAE